MVTSVSGLTMSDLSDHLPVYVTIEEVRSNSVEGIKNTEEIKFVREKNGFSFENLKALSNVNIYSLDGTLLASKTADNGTTILFPERCRKGIYVVNINNGYQNSTFKYILNH